MNASERVRNNSDSHLRCRVSLSICHGHHLITWSPPGRPRPDSGPAQNPDQDDLKLSSDPEWTLQWQGSDMLMVITLFITDGITRWWRDTWRGGLMGLGATEVTVSLSNCPLTTEHAQCAHHSPGRCLVPVPGSDLRFSYLRSPQTPLSSARPVQPAPAKLMSLNVCYLNLTDFLESLLSSVVTWLPHSECSKSAQFCFGLN